MHDTPSTAYNPLAYLPHSFRYRRMAGPGVPRLQQKPGVAVLVTSRAWSCRLRSIARAIVTLAQCLCLIAVSIIVVPATRAQIPTHSPSIDRFANFIVEASARFAVPVRWIRAIIEIESAGDAHAISARGAMGLMQLMPGTWAELGARYHLGLDPFDPRDNVMAGTAYVSELRERYGSAGFLAAYHAGPRRYEQHLATGEPLPTETTAYVAAVTTLLSDRHGELTAIRIKRPVPWREAPVFVERAAAP